MPKIRRLSLPPALFNHLLDRISERAISADQLAEFADWLDSEPDGSGRHVVQAVLRNVCLR